VARFRAAADCRLDSRPSAAAPGPCWAAGPHSLDLGTGAEALLAVPAGPPGPRPLLVFFHGAGATAAQSVAALGPFVEQRGLLLLAPSSIGGTWDLLAGGCGRDLAVLDEALDQVARRCPVSRTAVGGFSDGASYALSVGLANGDLAEAVLAFSPGFAAPPVVVGRPRVWISHGRADRVLPVDVCGRRVAGALSDEGYAVTYEEFDDGHELPRRLLASGLAWWLGG
jgi:phospholipase/carboxylesterase